MKRPDKTFTYEEVAAILGISRTTIYNWQESGLLPNGDFDIEKLEEAVNYIIDTETKKLEIKIKRMKLRLEYYKTE